ncbi:MULTISPECIES: PilZ domain-containing protein [Sphingomonas]|jgi:hypothetical protein|uniref:PilZ domain-containing protein n=1 Tax=Sphingomonas TaxID=13687 RepID=UPI00193B7668|nr:MULTISPECIES: PilZ domain-containing protein [Sphingomonas]
MDDLTENPRQKRSSVIVRALVSLPDSDRQVERRVRNLSLTGACIEHQGEMQVGMTLRIDMGTLRELRGTVMWITDRLAGLRFEQPVNLDEARKPRAAAVTSVGGIQVGWMAEVRHAYRR